MSGPIGIVKVGMDKPQSVTWAQYFIMLSVGLGVVNLIPIPVLDGGRVVILLVESALRRRLSERTLRYLLFPSAAFLLLLLVFLSIKDIINW